ncbi:hypothetical protein AB1Y20_000331 [Prymnesium parvum]|uniref:Serine hydrolase domain-containing protein n=1 Tax=Prymnesium parvum TaxID=97485 RepID=A0AB34K4J8_PRYPA
MPLSLEELLAAQGDALADDIEIDFEKMRLWTKAQVSAYFESGGTQLPVATGTGSAIPAVRRAAQRPLRILCLHGGGSNKLVTQNQTGKIAHMLGDDARFDFLEGPRIFPDAEVDAQLKAAFGKGPYYGWYGVDYSDRTNRPYIEKLEDHSVVYTYHEVEKAIDKVSSYMSTHGPFDVLLGFSQGAIIITLLTAMRLKAAREHGGSPPDWLLNVRNIAA